MFQLPPRCATVSRTHYQGLETQEELTTQVPANSRQESHHLCTVQMALLGSPLPGLINPHGSGGWRKPVPYSQHWERKQSIKSLLLCLPQYLVHSADSRILQHLEALNTCEHQAPTKERLLRVFLLFILFPYPLTPDCYFLHTQSPAGQAVLPQLTHAKPETCLGQ